MSNLTNTAIDFALDALEKRGVLSAFCMYTTQHGEPAYIGVENEESTYDEVATAVRRELKQRISLGEVSEFAFCIDANVKYQHSPESVRVLEVEYQNGTASSARFHLQLEELNGTVRYSDKYFTLGIKEKLL